MADSHCLMEPEVRECVQQIFSLIFNSFTIVWNFKLGTGIELIETNN